MLVANGPGGVGTPEAPEIGLKEPGRPVGENVQLTKMIPVVGPSFSVHPGLVQQTLIADPVDPLSDTVAVGTKDGVGVGVALAGRLVWLALPSPFTLARLTAKTVPIAMTMKNTANGFKIVLMFPRFGGQSSAVRQSGWRWIPIRRRRAAVLGLRAGCLTLKARIRADGRLHLRGAVPYAVHVLPILIDVIDPGNLYSRDFYFERLDPENEIRAGEPDSAENPA